MIHIPERHDVNRQHFLQTNLLVVSLTSLLTILTKGEAQIEKS